MRKKNKFIPILYAAFMIMAAFFTPMTAYANEETHEPITDYDEEESMPVFDIDGLEELDLSDLADLDFDEQPNESAIPDNSKPFTPDGQASVVDLAYEGDGKMFYTFKTPAGNVFYLIIDLERGMDNVYFLNTVTEYDLLALAESGENMPNVPESAIPTTTKPSTTNPNGNGGTDENTDDPDAENDNPPKKSNNGMLIFLLIGVAAVGIGAYYIKVIRPKQQAGMDDEGDDIPDEDNGEEMQFEDEPEEADDGDEYEDNEDDGEKHNDE